jgi:hypothetical protein
MDSSRDMVIREEHGSFQWVMLLEAPSRRALTRMVKERNWHASTGCGADCTGRVFAADCTLLRAYRDRDRWLGVVVCREYRDV